MQVSFKGQNNYQVKPENPGRRQITDHVGKTALTLGIGTLAGEKLVHPLIAGSINAANISSNVFLGVMQDSIKKVGGSEKFAETVREFGKKILPDKVLASIQKEVEPGLLLKFAKNIEKTNPVNAIKRKLVFAEAVNKTTKIPAIAIGMAGTFAVASALGNVGKFAKAVINKVQGNKNKA